MAAVNGEAEKEKPELLFPGISADNDTGLTEVSSLCINCEEQGITKFLFIQIPFYREVILSSFSCSHCGYSNNEIQSAGSIQEKAIAITLHIKSINDLNRQVVRGDTATVKIPELDFEIPASSQKGTLSTVEGIIQRAIEGLEFQQPIRRAIHPELAEKLDGFVIKLKELLSGDRPFTLKIDDPSGNSFIENPNAPSADPDLTSRFYVRTLEQDKFLGLQPDDAEEKTIGKGLPTDNNNLDLTSEVLKFATNCPGCNAPSETNMKMINIPHFKEVIIMATNCDLCGHRSNEVKAASGFAPTGRKLTLKVTDVVDLSRDVLKSETCTVKIPELDLESGGLAICGKFSTVEGLLLDLKKTMIDSNPFVGGDSAKSFKLQAIGDKLVEFSQGKYPCTLILDYFSSDPCNEKDDPNSNSYIQDIYEPEVDPNLQMEEYERSIEQNEELGLNDMNTENYL